jgi:hypothetical protein
MIKEKYRIDVIAWLIIIVTCAALIILFFISENMILKEKNRLLIVKEKNNQYTIDSLVNVIGVYEGLITRRKVITKTPNNL